MFCYLSFSPAKVQPLNYGKIHPMLLWYYQQAQGFNLSYDLKSVHSKTKRDRAKTPGNV